MKLTLGMSNLKFSLSESHPNKMVIEGCITKINSASDGAPCGSDGKRIVFTQDSINKNYQSFELMPVNCTFPDGWFGDGTEVFTGHGSTNIGVIQKVWPEGEDLMAQIIVWKMLFPDISFMAVNGKDSLGFSIEVLADQTHDDNDNGFLYIDEFTGTGCAMLWKNTAAFSGTYIRELVASLQNKKAKDDVNMNEEQMKVLLDGFVANIKAEVGESISKVNEEMGKLALGLAETQESLKAQAEEKKAAKLKAAEDKAKVEEEAKLKAEQEKIKAAQKEAEEKAKFEAAKPPVPGVGQFMMGNSDLKPTDADRQKKLDEIYASNMSTLEKCKAVSRLNLQKAE